MWQPITLWLCGGSTVGRLAVTTRLCLQEKLHEGEALEAEMSTGLTEQSNKNKTCG